MRKFYCLIIIAILSISVPVHAQHLKFMEIPLNGTITQFQEKLKAKGMRYDKFTSQHFPEGSRFFDGVFAGEKARLIVYYDIKTKIVWRAKVTIDYSTKEIWQRKYSEMREILLKKYGYDSEYYDGEQDGYDAFELYVRDTKGKTLGRINLYFGMFDYKYTLFICYTDEQNEEQNNNSIMRDF